MIGQAARYQVRWSTRPIAPAGFGRAHVVRVSGRPGRSGTAQRLRLKVPRAARYLAIRALDPAGNIGAEVTVRLSRR